MPAASDLSAIGLRRLHNQRITAPAPAQPAALVAWLGAVQAQEYPAATWGLGLRMAPSTTRAAIERAFNHGRILRTHVLRPTWHFVAAPDIRWMLELSADRVHQGMAFANRYFEVDDAMRRRAARLFERALRDAGSLTRVELATQLALGGLTVKGTRLALLTIYAELEQVICSGPIRRKQHTYALLDVRAPQAARLSRDEALGKLAGRFFTSHGPATIRDFVWWSGLRVADAKRAIEICGARDAAIDGRVYWTCGNRRSSTRGGDKAQQSRDDIHLLPIYDEYIVAYRDHHAVPRPPAKYGLLPQAIVAGGQVIGTWKPVRTTDGVVVQVKALRRFTPRERQGIAETVARYGRFVGMPASVRSV